ncbi:hypothetical protein [Rhodopseudomonas sp. B29]
MNPTRPFATHVAVRDGRIVDTGSAEELCSTAPRSIIVSPTRC